MLIVDGPIIDDSLSWRMVFISVILVLISVGGVGAVTNVNSCGTINSSGEYVLTTDITDSGATKCIEITSSNVVFDGANHTIDGMDASNTYGVYVYNISTTLTNVTVKNLEITDWYYGIYYRNSANGRLVNNTAISNTWSGIYLYSSSNYNTLTSNNASSNNQHGIWVYSSSDNILTNNNADSNGNNGIILYSSSGSILMNNTVNSNYYGIYLSSSSSNTLVNNNASSNNGRGIYLYYSSNNNITNNNASSNSYYGVYLTGSSGNILTNNIANSNNGNNGISLTSSSNGNTLTNNIANSNTYGIYLTSSSNGNIIKDNTAQENNVYDVYIYAGSDADCNNIIVNTTGSGNRPIKYFNDSINLQNETLSELILCNTDNSNIDNVTIEGSTTEKNNGLLVFRTDNSNFTNINSSNNRDGIHLLSSSNNNTLIDNTANSNGNSGIIFYYSSNNTATNNTATSNIWRGIELQSSSNNSIENNNASNNYNGIALYSSDSNTLSSNTVLYNGYGIYLYSSRGNNIANNNASSSGYFGIYIGSSGNNIITNNFFNNTNNFLFGGTIYNNTWNNSNSTGPDIVGGPYLGGNFWAYPNGTGFSETCTDADGDGFCDSYYNLTSGNVDYLPLAKTVEQDFTAPTITIVSPDNMIYNKTNISIEVSADEAIGTWWYSLNSGNNVTFTLNTTINVSDGFNTLVVYANDSVGNTGSRTLYFTVDEDLIWAQIWNGSAAETAEAVAVDSNNSVYVAGYSNLSGEYDYAVIKYSSNGTQLWNRTFDGGYADLAKGIAVDSNNNVIVTGIRWTAPSAGSGDYYTIKYDSNGNQLWNRTFDKLNRDVASSVAADSLDNIIVVGRSWNPSELNIIKYDESGTTLWNVSENGDGATDVAVDSNNNIILVGYINNTDLDYLIVKYNSSGSKLWNKTYDGGSGDDATGVAIDSSDNIIITGASSLVTPRDWHTIKYDENGTELWNTTYTGVDTDYAYDMALDSVDEILVVGRSANTTVSGTNNWHMIKYYSNGIQKWNKTYDGGEDDYALSVVYDSNDDFIVAGFSVLTSITGSSDKEIFIVKYSEEDTTPPTITITSPQNTTYTSSSVPLNVSTSKPIDTWWYSLNAGPNITFVPNTTIAGQVGSNTLIVYANDTTSNIGSSTVWFTINQTGYNITLLQGWNLISLPLAPENTSLDAVLASIDGNYSVVYRWADCIWTKSTAARNPLAEMTVEYGYWIYMTAPDTLELTGTQPALTTINVTNACWNLVGYPSLTPENLTTVLSPINHTVVYAYVNGVWKKSTAVRNPLTEMSPGYGYWIDANEVGSYEVVN